MIPTRPWRFAFIAAAAACLASAVQVWSFPYPRTFLVWATLSFFIAFVATHFIYSIQISNLSERRKIVAGILRLALLPLVVFPVILAVMALLKLNACPFTGDLSLEQEVCSATYSELKELPPDDVRRAFFKTEWALLLYESARDNLPVGGTH